MSKNRKKIVVYSVTHTEISAYLQTFEEIRSLQQGFDRFVTFAAGGFPLLSYISEPGAEERLHLFAGLNWGGGNQPAFEQWLSNNLGLDLFLFDTGTEGNAIRQLAKIVRRVVPQCTAQRRTSRISIFGVVDGHRSSQREVDTVINAQCGANVTLSVRYRHVPRVFPEDCDPLLAYSSNQPRATMTAIRSPGVLQILGEPEYPIIANAARALGSNIPVVSWGLKRLLGMTTPVHVSASMSASDNIRDYLENNTRNSPKKRWRPDLASDGIGLIMLSVELRCDTRILEVMCGWGLITDDVFLQAVAELKEEAADLADRFPIVEWEWVEKRIMPAIRREVWAN